MSRGAVRVVVCATGAMGAAHVAGMLGFLSDDERSRQARFGFAEDRRDYVAAHVLLRMALAAGAGPFSLSHSRGLVACAVVERGRVGVDVETVDERVDALEIARRYFALDEAAALDGCTGGERAERFCELWTLKEAYAKATGVGLGGSLREPAFSVSAAGDVRARGAPGWTFVSADVMGTHKLAVAADRPVDVCLRVADPLALTTGLLRTSELTGAAARVVR